MIKAKIIEYPLEVTKETIGAIKTPYCYESKNIHEMMDDIRMLSLIGNNLHPNWNKPWFKERLINILKWVHKPIIWILDNPYSEVQTNILFYIDNTWISFTYKWINNNMFLTAYFTRYIDGNKYSKILIFNDIEYKTSKVVNIEYEKFDSAMVNGWNVKPIKNSSDIQRMEEIEIRKVAKKLDKIDFSNSFERSVEEK